MSNTLKYFAVSFLLSVGLTYACGKEKCTHKDHEKCEFKKSEKTGAKMEGHCDPAKAKGDVKNLLHPKSSATTTALAKTTSVKSEIKVEGMSCESCVKHIEEALLKQKGINTAKVDLKNKTATIEYEKGTTSGEALAQLVAGLGYKTQVIR